MNKLKGVIFSLRDVLVKPQLDGPTLDSAVKLLRFLLDRGIQPVLIGNKKWTMTASKIPFEQYLSKKVGAKLPAMFGGTDFRRKEDKASMQAVLDRFGWTPQEALYVGSTDLDMRAAKSGGLLFLNAKWYATNSRYGLTFDSAKDIARFVDCFCLTPGDWFWSINDNGLRCYSIAPLAEYSPRHPEAKEYSTDAKQAAKFDRGDIRFWGLMMASRLHFSGLAAEAKYVVPYPGHRTDSPKTALTKTVGAVSGLLGSLYLEDFFTRHTTALKSQALRQQKLMPTPENQLTTVHLTRAPKRTGAQGLRYLSPPDFNGETVLVIDDICTQGNSFECARAFIQARGGNAIGVTLLKTPANDYLQVQNLTPPIRKHYVPYAPTNLSQIKHRMDRDITNARAPAQIADAFSRYNHWDWPD